MKKITLMLVSLWLMTAFVIAQIPQAFKYQAVARTSSGNLIQNQLVAFRISILQGGPSGTLLYQERHTTNTNNYGLANLDIGNGTVLSGVFSSINWSQGQMYIKVELDPLGGTAYQNMGTSQLFSVPYALHSNTSTGLTLPFTGSGSNDASAFSVTNTGTGNGISGSASGSSGYGVYGYGNIGTGGFSPTGYGIYGVGVNGVFGDAYLDGGIGVHGLHNFATGAGSGVLGQSYSSQGTGVKGSAPSTGGVNYGIFGSTESPAGFGVYGSGPMTGIKGVATIASGESFGVYGTSVSFQGYGVYGKATAGSGANYGVYGESQSIIGTGVYGLNSTLSGGWCSGVTGKSTSSSGIGVYGLATSASGQTKGVRGFVSSDDGYSGYFEGGKFYVDGNVGIGTISPSRNLSVKGTTGSFANFITDATGSSSTDGLLIGSGTGYSYLLNYENSALVIGTNNQYDIFIQATGNIGIGTLTPNYLLDVGGIVNLNKGISSGIALRCNGDEALWYNNTYYSWGYAATYNFFGNKLKIAGNGNVAPSYELVVDGNAAKSLGGSTWIVSSDLGLKNLNGNYTRGLDEIMALQPVRFNYKAGNSRGLSSEVEQVGFIAQEVQKVFPEAVYEGEDGLLDFNMHPVNVAMINAIKELKSENDRLKAEIEKINARLDKFDASMSLSATK